MFLIVFENIRVQYNLAKTDSPQKDLWKTERACESQPEHHLVNVKKEPSRQERFR